MVRITIEVDHVKTVVENIQIGMGNVNHQQILQMVMASLGTVGGIPSEEAILDFFGLLEDEEEEANGIG
jgi:hypothetical protein